jgi:hypothetical protein
MEKKTPAPTVDRAVTVGGFSASTPLPVGGPTAPATPFHCSVQGWFEYTPLRPEVKTGSECLGQLSRNPPLRRGLASSVRLNALGVPAGDFNHPRILRLRQLSRGVSTPTCERSVQDPFRIWGCSTPPPMRGPVYRPPPTVYP